MKKGIILLLSISTMLSGCSSNPNKDIALAGDNISTTSINNETSTEDNDEIIADTIIGLTAYGRDYISNFISDTVLQIIVVAEEKPLDEFKHYYEYSGEAISSTCESFGIDAVYIKTVDANNSPMFEFCFTSDGTTYLIAPEHIDEISEIIN
jgi:hypothetical protein